MLEYFLILLVAFFGLTSVFLVYDRYTRHTRASESSVYLDALRELLDGRQESAFSKLRQVVAADSNNIDAYLRLGQILRDHNSPQRALQVHKDLTLRTGLSKADKVSILHQLVLDYLALKEYPTAEAALREMISLESDHRWAHSQLLGLQERNSKWDEAYDTAAHILKLESNKSKTSLARYKYFAGLQLYKKREYHKARVILKEAIGLDPNYVQAYLTIGDSYYDEKRLEDAVNFWVKLIEAVPAQGHLAIERLKKALFELGRFGDIVDICQRILEHDPKNLEARRSLVEFYVKKGDLNLAAELLEQIVDDHPDDISTLIELVRFHVEKGDRRRLQELLKTLERKRESQKKPPLEKSVDAVPVGSQS